MALTKSTYVQAARLTFQDSTVSPATLAAGTLFQRFELRAFPQKGIKYTGTVGVILATPVLSLGVAGVGGTFAAGTYFWKVTALNAKGETVGSNEVTATALLNGTQPLTWLAITGAVSYKVYRGTVTNTENALITTTAALTYTDTGTVGTVAAVPTVDTTGVIVPKAPRTTHGAGS